MTPRSTSSASSPVKSAKTSLYGVVLKLTIDGTCTSKHRKRILSCVGFPSSVTCRKAPRPHIPPSRFRTDRDFGAERIAAVLSLFSFFLTYVSMLRVHFSFSTSRAGRQTIVAGCTYTFPFSLRPAEIRCRASVGLSPDFPTPDRPVFSTTACAVIWPPGNMPSRHLSAERGRPERERLHRADL